MRLSRVFLPAVLFLGIVPLSGAVPQQRETTTVEVVQVPVYVTSRGASVRSLTRDDFTLRINGHAQKIDYFDVVDFASLSSDQTRDPRQRRLYVLTFDLVNAAPFSMQRAKLAAEQYLAGAQASDYFAVALLNRHDDIEFIVPFTRDQAALRRAVASFSAASPSDPLRLTISPAERVALISNDAGEISGLQRMGAGVMSELAAEADRRRVDDQFDALGQLARRLAPLEGYKHVVLLSRGFSSYLLRSGGSLRSGGGQSIPEGPRSGPMQQLTAPHRSQQFGTPGFDSRLLESQSRMQKEFASAGVFLDAIDIAGLRPSGRNAALHVTVADTGGQVVGNRNDLKAAMQTLTDSQQVVYVLGFHAPDTGRTQNDIAVKVKGAPRGSYVSYRESYSSIADKPSTRDALRLADIVTNDIPENGITMTTSIATAPKRATVNIALPGEELLALNDVIVQGQALIYVFAGQTSVAFAEKGIDVDVTRARENGLASGGIALTQSFDLPPGAYTMKVLVRIDSHDTLAFARKDFTVEE